MLRPGTIRTRRNSSIHRPRGHDSNSAVWQIWVARMNAPPTANNGPGASLAYQSIPKSTAACGRNQAAQ